MALQYFFYIFNFVQPFLHFVEESWSKTPLRFVFSLNIYMYYLLSNKSAQLVLISFLVYLFVNLFENLVHYNIGKFSNRETHFELPTKKDWLKIIVVMIMFALLQGFLTVYFNR